MCDFHLSRISNILKNGFDYKLWAGRNRQQIESCVNNQRVMVMIDDNKLHTKKKITISFLFR